MTFRPPPPEDGVSANFTTRANLVHKRDRTSDLSLVGAPLSRLSYADDACGRNRTFVPVA